MATKSGLLRDGVVNDDQNHQDQTGYRERGTGTAGAKDPGQIADGCRDQADTDQRRPQRFLGATQLIGALILAKLRVNEECNCEDTQKKGRVIHSRSSGTPLRQMTCTEPLQFGRCGNRNGMRDPNDSAAENHCTAQGSNEAGDAHFCNPEAVPCANQSADGQGQQHSCPPGEIPLLERYCHDHTAETGN